MKGSKGMELPVNVMVVLAIAVLVMLGVIAIFVAGSGQAVPLVASIAKGNACNVYVGRNCDGSNTVPANYDVNGDGSKSDDKLDGLMKEYYGCNNEACIKRACGCPGFKPCSTLKERDCTGDCTWVKAVAAVPAAGDNPAVAAAAAYCSG